MEFSLKALCKLSKLQHLDISQCNESRGQFLHPGVFMETLVTELPRLRSLDISGTNLAGTGPEDRALCDINGLSSRWDIGRSDNESRNYLSLAELENLWTFLDFTKHTMMPAVAPTSPPYVYQVRRSMILTILKVKRHRRHQRGSDPGGREALPGQAGCARVHPQWPLPRVQIWDVSEHRDSSRHFTSCHGGVGFPCDLNNHYYL